MGVITVATMFGSLLLAIALFEAFGLWLGAILWILAYALFMGACRAVKAHIDPHDEDLLR